MESSSVIPVRTRQARRSHGEAKDGKYAEAGVIQHLKFIILMRGHAPDSQRAFPPSALRWPC